MLVYQRVVYPIDWQEYIAIYRAAEKQKLLLVPSLSYSHTMNEYPHVPSHQYVVSFMHIEQP